MGRRVPRTGRLDRPAGRRHEWSSGWPARAGPPESGAWSLRVRLEESAARGTSRAGSRTPFADSSRAAVRIRPISSSADRYDMDQTESSTYRFPGNSNPIAYESRRRVDNFPAAARASCPRRRWGASWPRAGGKPALPGGRGSPQSIGTTLRTQPAANFGSRRASMNSTPETPSPDTDLVFAPARELVRRIAARELGAEELMRRFLARIEEVNPAVNAIVTLNEEAALEGARAADAALARGEAPGPLQGLPVAVKDLTPTRGIRTTFGSPIYRDFVPDEDALYVERMRAAGAIIVGKTNTPEFGAGSQTFNPVFGATRNPYARERTCGGSSGGAAVAVACGMLPLADGTDMGGSLRNPASWSNVVGFRTSPGRVPVWPRSMLYNPLGVAGPIARHVADAALLLSAMAGPDPRVPLSIETPGGPVPRAARARLPGDPGRLEPDPRRLPGRAGGRRGLRGGGRALRGARLHGRGGGPRPPRRGRDLPDPARVLLRPGPRGAHPRPPRQAKGHRRVERREGARPRRDGRRPRGGQARRAPRSGWSGSSAATTTSCAPPPRCLRSPWTRTGCGRSTG